MRGAASVSVATPSAALGLEGNVTISTMKKLIYLGIGIGGTVGAWLGAIPDHGNWLGGWSILGSLVGSLAGIWLGYKIGKNYL